MAKNIDPPLPLPLPGRVQPLRTSPSSSAGLLALALAIGVAFQLLGPAWIRRILVAVSPRDVVGWGVVLVALIVTIVLHESGHLVAACLMRFRILSIGLGPLRLSYRQGKWELRASGKLFSASVSAIPKTVTRWRERMLIVVAAGPAMTLLSGIAAVLLFSSYSTHEWTRTFWAALAQLSCFIFLLGLIPNSPAAPARNDARLFLTIWNNTAEAREILLYHLVTQLKISGVSPRDYPEELIRGLAAVSQGRPDSMQFYAQTIELWARERDDSVTADAWLARADELQASYGIATVRGRTPVNRRTSRAA